MLLTALVLLALALGLDFAEGLPVMHPWNPYRAMAGNPVVNEWTQTLFQKEAYTALRHFSKSLEEFFEMAAMTLLWSAFVVRAGRRAPLIRLNTGVTN